MQKHKFPYNWRLSEAKFTKDKGKVFSCFACGGGSTMGYKLAGFDVIGCNEIDAKVNRCYVANHSPRYNFLEDSSPSIYPLLRYVIYPRSHKIIIFVVYRHTTFVV